MINHNLAMSPVLQKMLSKTPRRSWQRLLSDTSRKLQMPRPGWDKICLRRGWSNREEKEIAASHLGQYSSPAVFLAAHGIPFAMIVQLLSFYELTVEDERRFNRAVQLRPRKNYAKALVKAAHILEAGISTYKRDRLRAQNILNKATGVLQELRSLEFNRASYWTLFVLKEKLWDPNSSIPSPEISEILSRENASEKLRRFADVLRKITMRPRGYANTCGRSPEKLRWLISELHKLIKKKGDPLTKKLALNIIAALLTGHFPGFQERMHPLRACKNLYQEPKDLREEFVEEYSKSPGGKWRVYSLMAKNRKLWHQPPQDLQRILKAIGGKTHRENWLTLEKKAWSNLSVNQQQNLERVMKSLAEDQSSQEEHRRAF